jgi:Bacterial regulatory proteins, luxR family
VTLTRREYDVVSALAEGLTWDEVAARLHISYNTVGSHVEHVSDRLIGDERPRPGSGHSLFRVLRALGWLRIPAYGGAIKRTSEPSVRIGQCDRADDTASSLA